jgi:hypothetical protein
MTSALQGLEDKPGFQQVLRENLSNDIADRLVLRSGYSHPYPFGDSRNPIVYFHRVERFGASDLHVLARISDAGSDHSGRSNRLSEMVVLDDDTVGGLPGGPAHVARAFEWLRSWPSRGPVAPSLATDDPGPCPCGQWAEVTGDAGWAGELAKAFTEGRKAFVIAPAGAGESLVLALYEEALALLPPGLRWQVTFNTCDLEPFGAAWRAGRSDLRSIESRNARAGLVIDLEALRAAGQTAPDSVYAAFARGGELLLPWQRRHAEEPAGRLKRGSPGSPSCPTVTSHTGQAVPPAPTGDASDYLRRRRRHLHERSAMSSIPSAPQPERMERRRYSGGPGWVPWVLLLLGLPVMFFAGRESVDLWPRRGLGPEEPKPAGMDVAEDSDTVRDLPVAKPPARPPFEPMPRPSHAAPRDRAPAEASVDVSPMERGSDAEASRPGATGDSRKSDEPPQPADEHPPKAVHNEEPAPLKFQEEAIKAFGKWPEYVDLLGDDSRDAVDPVDNVLGDRPLGPFSTVNLLEPQFVFAEPLQEGRRKPCLSVEALPGERPMWSVSFTRNKGVDVSKEEILRLAVDDENVLRLEWREGGISAQHDAIKWLRNSVLLVSSRAPGKESGPAAIRREVRFVSPRAFAKKVDMRNGKVMLKVPMPQATAIDSPRRKWEFTVANSAIDYRQSGTADGGKGGAFDIYTAYHRGVPVYGDRLWLRLTAMIRVEDGQSLVIEPSTSGLGSSWMNDILRFGNLQRMWESEQKANSVVKGVVDRLNGMLENMSKSGGNRVEAAVEELVKWFTNDKKSKDDFDDFLRTNPARWKDRETQPEITIESFKMWEDELRRSPRPTNPSRREQLVVQPASEFLRDRIDNITNAVRGVRAEESARYFDPIEVSVRLSGVATDPEGNEYRVPLIGEFDKTAPVRDD